MCIILKKDDYQKQDDNWTYTHYNYNSVLNKILSRIMSSCNGEILDERLMYNDKV